MFDEGTDVSVTKVDVSEDPEYETPAWEDHNQGSHNPQQSLPVEYNVEGSLARGIVEGLPMVIHRHKRNGREVGGVMQTSAVQNVKSREDGVIVETLNSIYSLTEI